MCDLNDVIGITVFLSSTNIPRDISVSSNGSQFAITFIIENLHRVCSLN